MSSGFESTFSKLARNKKPKKTGGHRAPLLNLGSTESGKSQFKPAEPVREEAIGGLNIREIPASHGHATRQHGRRGGIRKIGGVWR